MIRATPREKSMATVAPMGIGLMYGPMSPPTNSMGSTAAMTVRVARMVGFPTSSTAARAAARRGRSLMAKCRSMFSATMMESSMTIPVTKIRAKRVTRFRVYPKIW